MKVSFSHISKPGPRHLNEDNLDCWTTGTGTTVAAIADGLGGMGEGDRASQIAVEELRRHLDQFGANEASLEEAARKAHQKIQNAQSASERQSRMATTLTALALSNSGIVGVHCGDSRAVIARGRGIKRLTKDHSEGQRLFDLGKLSKAELLSYERKHILESALGDKDEPQIDAFKFDLLPGDHVILTTDGVHDLILLREMQKISANSNSPSDLVQQVASAVEGYGPSDNYSIVALFAD